MNGEMKKRIVLISLLAVVLLALILVYIYVVYPMINGEKEKPVEKPPYVAEGEGLAMNNFITIYPQIDKHNITYIEINNEHGKYAFHKYFGDGMDTEEMRFVGYESLDFNQSMFSTLLAYIYLPVSYESYSEEYAPMRNLTDEQMAQYGVTEDTCQASYTLGFMENGVEKFHTVYIGYKTFSNDVTYYVSLKGRNSVYRFLQEGVESCLLASMEDYLSPFIFGKYNSVSEAMLNITRFKIGYTDPDKIGQDDFIRSLVEILKTGQNELGTANTYDLVYQSKGTNELVRTDASVTRLSEVFTAFYTYFTGDKVMCVNPGEEELKKYGLSFEQRQFFVTAQFSDDPEDIFSMQISDEIDGYYYTLSKSGGETELLIRVPKSSISFLTDDDRVIFTWASSDISSLFYEYLIRNEDDKKPGMNQIIITSNKKNNQGEYIYQKTEKFDIAPDGNDGVTVTQGNGTIYKTELNKDNLLENQFADYYQLLVCFPAPTEFNNMTWDEINALRQDEDALLFRLVARDNDNNLFKYSYYQIGKTGSVMVETCMGKMVDGVDVWEEAKVNFNTTVIQIEILRENLEILTSGKDVRPEDYIY